MSEGKRMGILYNLGELKSKLCNYNKSFLNSPFVKGREKARIKP
jgi:hypothetical protein